MIIYEDSINEKTFNFKGSKAKCNCYVIFQAHRTEVARRGGFLHDG